MSKRNKAWRVTAGVTTAFLLAPALVGFPAPGAVPAAYAAEQKGNELSREEAIQLVQQRIEIPAGYKLEDARYSDWREDAPSWNLSWKNDKDARIFIELDAVTGNIQRYSRFEVKPGPVAAAKLDAEAARQAAVRFLERVTSPEERAKLSEANEYTNLSGYSGGLREHSFTFTRVENGLPFLENGFEITLNAQGEVESFWRQWYEGELPEPSEAAISREEAENILSQGAAPSLVYSRQSSFVGNYLPADSSSTLIYQYEPLDPQFVDAVKGTLINALGEPAQARKIEPLGRTVADPDRERKTITREEAQRIADELIKKFPGSYRSEGNSGSGASFGPDGIERRRWSFAYKPLHLKEQNVESLELTIGDKGDLVGYDRYPSRFGNSGRKIEQGVSWDQAVQSAVKLVQTLFADRLGEIYLAGQAPNEEYIRELWERGESYTVRFGWLHNGVPIERADFGVAVDPVTGEAIEVRIFADELEALPVDTGEIVDLETARRAELAEKTLMLTYYQPRPEEYSFTASSRPPLLVYRYVGDSGFVDARSGEWVSHAALQSSQTPQDIADHPQQAALDLALRRGLFSVTDGKLEPERQVTRGEMAQIVARMSDWEAFHTRMFLGRDDEEERFSFADVDEKHPLFGAIQKNLRNGYIAKEGRNFEPDKPITRAEAAEMLARLLGYGDLLDNPEMFAPAFTDLQQDQIAAVTILHGEGIFPGKSATRFEPNGTLTRADVAELIKALIEYKE